VIIYEDNSNLDIIEFLDYCEEKKIKKIVLSSKKIDEIDYLEKQLLKNDLVNKILTYLGK
jgi:two-component system chemotaxis sensor kinase CheA